MYSFKIYSWEFALFLHLFSFLTTHLHLAVVPIRGNLAIYDIYYNNKSTTISFVFFFFFAVCLTCLVTVITRHYYNSRGHYQNYCRPVFLFFVLSLQLNITGVILLDSFPDGTPPHCNNSAFNMNKIISRTSVHYIHTKIVIIRVHRNYVVLFAFPGVHFFSFEIKSLN